MAVDLVFGKALLQSLGTKQGEELIKRLQEGQLLQIEARTNSGQRECVQKWVDMNCLELILTDCQLLSPDLGTVLDQPDDRDDSRAGKKKKIGSSSSALPILALDDIFNKSIPVKFVDDLDSVSGFSNDVSKLLSQNQTQPCDDDDDDDDKNSSSPSPLVGIDCEWQPREFMENNNGANNLPQPVLLLQISLHALQTVYLLDLQALLRPLKPVNSPMNKVEREVSNSLAQLMESKRIIKVGYQLSSDLRRIFASYPHLSCFQEVHSALEISSLIKKVLHISKQKKSRYVTTSLASMTSHYLGMALDKEHRK